VRAAVVAGIALVACGETVTLPPEPTGPIAEVASFPATLDRDLDLIFVVGDSANNDGFHVADAIDTLIGQLTLSTGGLVNLHVGVVSTDMGTAGSLDAAPGAPFGTCAGRGNDGVFQKNGVVMNGPFLVDEDDGMGGRHRNYAGSLADALAQMVKRGPNGCAVEQPLHALRRALEQPANGAFRRPTANLAVLFIGLQDDCSIRDPAFFTEPALGPLSFRCTAQGVACAEDMLVAGSKTGCTARVDSRFVDGIQPFVESITAAQPDRVRVAIAGIVGPRGPVTVDLRKPADGGDAISTLRPPCAIIEPVVSETAQPSVRLASFIDTYGSHGMLAPACSRDQAPQLFDVGRSFKQLFGIACLDTSLLADASSDRRVQPNCEIAEVDGAIVRQLPRCPFTDTDGRCYELVADAACPETPDHLRVRIRRTHPATPTTRVDVRCELRTIPP
jgi:hypothetical protein